MKVFAVYDAKGKYYLPPFVAPRRADAERGFAHLINTPDPTGKNNFSVYPDDFTLFELGDFDELTAKFTFYESMFSLGTGLSYKNK